MIFLENLRSKLESYKPKIKELSEVFDIENSKERVEVLHNKAAEPGFWDDLENSQKVLQETENAVRIMESYEERGSFFVQLARALAERIS